MKAVLTLLICLSVTTTSAAQSGDMPPESPAPESQDSEPAEEMAPMRPETESEGGLGPALKDEDDFDADILEPAPLLSTVRASRRFGIGGRYGLLVAPVAGLGIDAFYQPRSDIQFGILLFQGSQDFKNHLAATDGTTMEKHLLSANLTLLYGRYFFGDSWYVMGTLGQRIVKTEYELRSTTVNSYIKADNTATSSVLGTAIGNMWTWDKGFYAAIDWIGYLHPLSSAEDPHSETTGSSTPPATLENKRQDVEETFKDTGKLGTRLYLGFHLGYTF